MLCLQIPLEIPCPQLPPLPPLPKKKNIEFKNVEAATRGVRLAQVAYFNFVKFLRAPFLQSTSRRLLLKME